MKLMPHFTFDSRAKEALEFYVAALKGKVEVLHTYREYKTDLPEYKADLPEGIIEEYADKIMYAAFSFGEGNLIALCDMYPGSGPEKHGNTVYMDLELKAEEVKPIFDALAVDGQVLCPLSKTSWTDQFGCLTDKFGICWNILQEENK